MPEGVRPGEPEQPEQPEQETEERAGEQAEEELTVTPGLLGPTGPVGTTPASLEASEEPEEEADEDWARFGYTPTMGIPVEALRRDLRRGAPGEAPWPDRMRTLLRTPMSERPAFERTESEDRASEVSAPKIARVLDLTLRIGELLLASGEAAEDVEAAMLGVSHALGLDRCEPQVTFTLIAITYQPSLVEPPVTSTRVVRRRGSDYTRLASVYRLVADITSERVGVEEAYGRLAEIRRNRHPYPTWQLSLATGALAGAATMLVGGKADGQAWLVLLCAFVASVIGDRLAWLISTRGLPEFYQFVIAATPAAGLGVGLTLIGSNLRGSVIITGGLYALLPGRALVAAVADGLTGFYITAAARLLEVLYLVVGIVLGVTLVLYIGVNFGASLHPEQTFAQQSAPLIQLPAAMALTLCFAVLLQTSRQVLPVVTVIGGVGWTTFGVLRHAGISAIVCTAVAATVIGLFGQLASRYRYASSLPYVTAALGPLLPGSVIYLGLLSFTQNEPIQGLLSVIRAAALALALAVGVNLGGELARLFLKVPQGVGGGAKQTRGAAKRTRGF
ncbi:threonine/serine ThrE exporter family protein [Streptacidiphilus anmyonensis]|uniref:threonine/serine ThrE exporter family protein n=1 Tax=Streptacidiphilus anmyonensis TaxID=405782 RepID=UPI00069430C3|nr:threonine/serine exporter family protein [Streptacidiphilus anmyonensis]